MRNEYSDTRIYHYYHIRLNHKSMVYINKIISLTIKIANIDNWGFNKAYTIEKIKFAVKGIDKNGNEFSKIYPGIKRLDSTELKFKDNQDTCEIKIKVPYEICVENFKCKELILIIGYTDTEGQFIAHEIDLKSEITDQFIDFTQKVNAIIDKITDLEKTEYFKNKIKLENPFIGERDEYIEDDINYPKVDIDDQIAVAKANIEVIKEIKLNTTKHGNKIQRKNNSGWISNPCTNREKEKKTLLKWLKDNTIRKLNKNKTYTNNPKLTKLMETNMTFKELKEEKIRLRSEKLEIDSTISYIKSMTPKDKEKDIYLEMKTRSNIISDLLVGIETKIRQTTNTYELLITKQVSGYSKFDDKITFEETHYLYSDKDIEEPEKDKIFCVELLKELELVGDYILTSVRKLNK